MKKTKQIILLTLVFCVCLVSMGCKKAEKNETKKSSIEDNEKSTSDVDNSSESDKKWASTTNKVSADRCVGKEAFHPFDTYEELGVEGLMYDKSVQFSINVPHLHNGDSPDCVAVSNRDTDIVTVCNNIFPDEESKAIIEEVQKAPDMLFEKFQEHIETYIGSAWVFMDIESISIDKKENVTINDWSMTRLEGFITIGAEDVKLFDWKTDKYKYVAYTVIKEGVPIYMVHVDTSEDQKNSATLPDFAEKVAHTFKHWNFDDKDSGYDGRFFD